MKTILVADDDQQIKNMVHFFLTSEGFSVLTANDGDNALELIEQNQIDLAILDVMMPGKTGYQVCQFIRGHSATPVILLTARGEMVDKELGFQAGTDDYITKPFELKELLFRINALLRRSQVENETEIQIGQLKIDAQNYLVRIGNKELYLPLKEFEVLYKLASYPKKTFTRDQLIDAIWGFDYEGNDRTVDVHIKRLREHLTPESGVKIATIRGLGYRLEAIV